MNEPKVGGDYRPQVVLSNLQSNESQATAMNKKSYRLTSSMFPHIHMKLEQVDFFVIHFQPVGLEGCTHFV